MTSRRVPPISSPEPADSQSVGAPSADLVSDAGSGVVVRKETRDDTGSVEGAGGERDSAGGRSPPCGGSGAAPPPGAAKAAPSSLDTVAITGTAGQGSVPFSGGCGHFEAKGLPSAESARKKKKREDWLRGVGEETAEHRRGRAKALEQRSRALAAQLLERGEPAPVIRRKTRWFDQRATSQSSKIDRAIDCGTGEVEMVCLNCSTQHVQERRCNLSTLCLRCRGVVAFKKQLRFLESRKIVLANAVEGGLLRVNRRGGRWSEKLLTLTAPHVKGDSVGGRIGRICTAWTHFRRKLTRHWKELGASHSAHFYRSLEWTPGGDRAGHPHIHCWLFCPYLERDQLQRWWSESLVLAGLPPRNLDGGVVVDVREVYNGEKTAAELIKYLLKDIDAQGKNITPEEFAQVYIAFDERRLTQSSSGFIGLSESKLSCACGDPDWYIRAGRGKFLRSEAS